MANRIKLKGTSERSFDIGLGPKQTFDANNLTANRTWVLPDSNGTAGYVLSTDGTGNLSWAAGGSISSQARLQFTAASNGTGQTFTDVAIATFTNNTYANVFVNGVLLQTSEYSISGTTLTVSRYLSTGDNVVIGPTAAGGTPTGAQGTSWTAAGSIAVGDIFTGTVAGPVSPGATYTASTSSNTNFTTWIPININIADRNITNIIWDGTQYVMTCYNHILTSPDGITWTVASFISNRFWTNIAYGSGIYVAWSSTTLYSSTDLITWTSRQATGDVCRRRQQLAFGNGTFVACSENGGLYSSANGISWTLRLAPVDYFVFSVIWNGTHFYTSVYNNNTAQSEILRSTDGITWTVVGSNVIGGYIAAIGNSAEILFINTDFGATGPTFNTTYAKSTNGTTWTTGSLGQNIIDVTYLSGTYVCSGGYQTLGLSLGGTERFIGQQVLSSATGTSFTQKLATNVFGYGTTNGYTDIYPQIMTYVNGKLFMAVGNALYVGIADNMIYVGNTGTTAPAGTYRCLGSVNPDLPTYLWVRLS